MEADDNPESADAELRRVLDTSALELLADSGSPYEHGMRLLGSLMGLVVKGADFAPIASICWGFLTDGIDGPPEYARGLSAEQIENLMRMAAAESLALDNQSRGAMKAYFERWADWPESIQGNDQVH